MALETARTLVQQELEGTNNFIINLLQTDIPFVREMVDYLLKCGGKRIRPLVLLLSAKACHNHSEHPVQLAAVIELLHSATLLHDDVVDNSSLRRGHKTANIVWGNSASVLVGDFIYTTAFNVIVKLRNPAVLDIFAETMHYISEGELLQLFHTHSPDTTEAAYFDVIQRKTAKLFETSAELGVSFLEPDARKAAAMRHFGLDFGIAYQLIDDVLDYSHSPEETGKNIGNDLSEGKTTLPLIQALRKGSKAEVSLIREAIEKGSSVHLKEIIEIIESTGAIEYTAQAAKQYAHKACEALLQVPPSPYRQALQDLTEFVVERSY